MFLDKGTYLRNYVEFKEVHFSEDGYTGQIYFSKLDYLADMEQIDNLLEDMEELATPERSIISPNSIKFWFKDFVNFVNTERSEEFVIQHCLQTRNTAMNCFKKIL